MVHHQKTFLVKILINMLKYSIKFSLVDLVEKRARGSKQRANIAKIEIGAIPPPLISKELRKFKIARSFMLQSRHIPV